MTRWYFDKPLDSGPGGAANACAAPVGLGLRGLVAGAFTLLAATASAQPSPEGRLQLGRHLSVTPAVTFVAGRDTNFVRTFDGEPKSEFYVVPQLEGWLGRGAFRVNFASALEYNEASDNGTLNHFNFGRLDAGVGRIETHLLVSHRNHYAPPTDFVGFELGIKSRRVEDVIEGSGSVRVGGRFSIGGIGRRTRLRYDADQRFQGASLQLNLNRDSEGVGGMAALALTPLTSLAASVEMTRDRFLYAPSRNGTGYRIMAGTQFKPRALMSGRAEAGYLRYTTTQSGETYGGPTYRVGLSFDRGALFLDANGSRVIDFSFDPSRGFYVSTGLDLFAVLRLGQTWELFTRGSVRELSPQGPARLEEPIRGVGLIKSGLAYRLGLWTRIGAEVERYEYGGPGGFRGVRVITFITYGSRRLQRLDRPMPGEF